jgi:hypothetical protein
MGVYLVDFRLTGRMRVDADDEAKAIELVEKMQGAGPKLFGTKIFEPVVEAVSAQEHEHYALQPNSVRQKQTSRIIG